MKTLEEKIMEVTKNLGQLHGDQQRDMMSPKDRTDVLESLLSGLTSKIR